MSAYHEFIQPFSQEELIRAFETEDLVGCVLRIHLHVEKLLVVALKSSINSQIAKVITSVPQNFSNKVQLAAAFGVPVEICLAVLDLNALRNRIGHNLGQLLAPQDVLQLATKIDAFRAAFFPEDPSVMASAIELYSTGSGKRQFGGGEAIWDFKIASGLLYKWMLRYWAQRGWLSKSTAAS